jgi:hypothetical protein
MVAAGPPPPLSPLEHWGADALANAGLPVGARRK